MGNLLKVESRSCFCIGVCAWIVAAFLLLSPNGNGQEGSKAEKKKPVILVPPFENQSKQREKIDYQPASEPKRIFKVDRYTMAPRTLFENMLSNIDGVTIVERQRVDTLLAESEFGQLSGLVDPEKAIKLGKLVGANLIVVGTIVDVSEETKKFKGYGIETENTTVTSQLRIRLLEIETGSVLFSKVVKGSKTYTKSNFGGTKSSDRNFAAIEVAIDKIGEDSAFRAAALGKKLSAAELQAAKGSLIEVEFSPKPDNCDIEIDGKYVGGSPLKRRLTSGTDYKIRISKGGFKDWTGTVTAEAGLRITRELEPSK